MNEKNEPHYLKIASFNLVCSGEAFLSFSCSLGGILKKMVREYYVVLITLHSP